MQWVSHGLFYIIQTFDDGDNKAIFNHIHRILHDIHCIGQWQRRPGLEKFQEILVCKQQEISLNIRRGGKQFNGLFVPQHIHKVTSGQRLYLTLHTYLHAATNNKQYRM